jgi:hypothetical protein
VALGRVRRGSLCVFQVLKLEYGSEVDIRKGYGKPCFL